MTNKFKYSNEFNKQTDLHIYNYFKQQEIIISMMINGCQYFA